MTPSENHKGLKVRLDRWMYPRPRMAPDEVAIWNVLANRDQGSRAVGGSLTLTNQRLCFRPSRVEGLLGGRGWEANRSASQDVGVADREVTQALAGGLRSRVRVVMAGTDELFVVASAENLATRLRADLGL